MPALTVSLTGFVWGQDVPAGGSVLITSFCGTVGEVCCSIAPGVSPAALSAF